MSPGAVDRPGGLNPVGTPTTAAQRTASAADARIERALEPFSHLTATLPPELMAEGARRLGWLALMYAIGVCVTRFGRRILLILSDSADIGFHGSDVLGVATAALSVAVFVVARRRLLAPKRLLDLGLAFQVLAAFDIAATRAWTGALASAGWYGLLPSECVLIVAYPLVVPNTPGKVLLASLLAASMGPATVVVSAALGGTVLDRPAVFATYFLISTYACAVAAYVGSRVVHRVGMRLKQARAIGSYELVEKIGEGGMGEVWRAKHRLLARPAAIKLIRADVLGTSQDPHSEAVRRFEREAQETATLRSVHTIDVYDFGVTEDGDFYYVMELLDGISLERFVQTYGPMEPARVVFVLRQVCHSLAEAHARGLVHRDVKPPNIFICRLGPDDDFVKVLDFGLVKHAAPVAMTATPLTLAGFAAGTPAFMAPEIALAEPEVDGRADLYALGCVAYYLLTGQFVFPAETPIAAALAHVNDAPAPPSGRSSFRIPARLEALILQCLAKDPAERPASAVDLANRLADAVPQEDAWTAESARAWWDQHELDERTASAADAAPIGRGAERQRCWPRLDPGAPHHRTA
ncbi:MAG TPA: serine/threonine-protein kinase [Vicinamibacterales bacterium]|nr:serine/threonine-protein kinase [Vicinamibacterales bacterium]